MDNFELSPEENDRMVEGDIANDEENSKRPHKRKGYGIYIRILEHFSFTCSS